MSDSTPILKEKYDNNEIMHYAAGAVVEDPSTPPEGFIPDNEALDTNLGPQSGIQAQGLQQLGTVAANRADKSLDEYKANMYNTEWLASHNLGMAMGSLSMPSVAGALESLTSAPLQAEIAAQNAAKLAAESTGGTFTKQAQVAQSQARAALERADRFRAQSKAMRGYADGGDVSTTSASPPEGFIPDDPTMGITAESPPPEGFIPDSEVNEEKYGTPKEMVKTGLEGAARGLMGSAVATGAERALGVDPADIRGREATNPTIAGLSDAGAFLGSAFIPMGQAAVIGRGAEALVKASGISSKIGQAAIKGAAEFGLMDASDEVGKLIKEDPAAAAQSAISGIGLDAALGAGIGASLGGIGKLAEAVGETKLGSSAKQAISDMWGTIRKGTHGGDPQELIKDELEGLHSQAEAAKEALYGGQDLKREAINSLLPNEMSDEMTKHVEDVIGKAEDYIAKAQERPDIHPPHITNQLDQQIDRFKGELQDAENSPAKVYDALQNFKRTMYESGNPRMPVPSHDPAHSYVSFAKGLASDLKQGLENPEIWGKAGQFQQEINSHVAPMIDHLKNLQGAFMSKLPDGSHIMDEGKIAAFLKGVDKPSQAKKVGILKDFISANTEYQKQIDKAYRLAGVEHETIIPTSVAAINDLLKQKSVGQKLGEAFLSAAKPAEHLGVGIGAGAGHAILPGYGAVIGAKVGEKVLTPMFEKIFKTAMTHNKNEATMAAIKEAMQGADKTIASEDMAALGQHMSAIYKGQQMMDKGAKALFKKGAKDLMDQFTPSDAEIKGLKKKLAISDQDPSPEQLHGKLGAVAPNQAQQMAATTYAAKQMLKTAKPSSDPKAPLDQKLPISKQDQAKYNNQLQLAQQPNMALAKMQKGTLTLPDVTMLRTLYPGWHKQMSQKIMKEVVEAQSKGTHIPYQLKQQLTLFLGQPMESSLSQQQIAAAQATYTPQSKQQGNPAGALGANKKQTHAVDKLVAQYQTPEQSRIARENKK